MCDIIIQTIYTTLNNGYLGSRNDEERSKMRYVMWIAKLRESSNLWTQTAVVDSNTTTTHVWASFHYYSTQFVYVFRNTRNCGYIECFVPWVWVYIIIYKQTGLNTVGLKSTLYCLIFYINNNSLCHFCHFWFLTSFNNLPLYCCVFTTQQRNVYVYVITNMLVIWIISTTHCL